MLYFLPFGLRRKTLGFFGDCGWFLCVFFLFFSSTTLRPLRTLALLHSFHLSKEIFTLLIFPFFHPLFLHSQHTHTTVPIKRENRKDTRRERVQRKGEVEVVLTWDTIFPHLPQASLYRIFIFLLLWSSNHGKLFSQWRWQWWLLCSNIFLLIYRHLSAKKKFCDKNKFSENFPQLFTNLPQSNYIFFITQNCFPAFLLSSLLCNPIEWKIMCDRSNW